MALLHSLSRPASQQVTGGPSTLLHPEGEQSFLVNRIAATAFSPGEVTGSCSAAAGSRSGGAGKVGEPRGERGLAGGGTEMIDEHGGSGQEACVQRCPGVRNRRFSGAVLKDEHNNIFFWD